MAAGDKYVGCANPHISEEELLASCLVKTNTGITGLRVVRISAAHGNVSSLVGCGTFNLCDEQVMRYAIGLNAQGNPSIVLIEET